MLNWILTFALMITLTGADRLADQTESFCRPDGEGGEICTPIDDHRYYCLCQGQFVPTLADCECTHEQCPECN